jgi:Ni,Fe-hydrogenase III large subunit
LKKLLGIINHRNEEKFIFQENGTLSIVNSRNYIKPKNYDLIKGRNALIANNRVTGDTVFNFRYGPVTGGVAEAGIYNIYTSGEKILSVEIDISLKRRDIENNMQNKNVEEALKMAEAVCGNFSFSHSVAFSRAVEKVSGINLCEEKINCRVIGMELERVYNHFYVIAELAKGAAQKILASHLQYLFEECLRINELFSGSRHLLFFNGIGEIRQRINKKNLEKISVKLEEIEKRFKYLYKKSLESGNYLDRLHNTGIILKDKAVEIGLTGPSLRASGVKEDLRNFDVYYDSFNVPVKEEGDSLARMEVRAEEIFISIDLIKNKIRNLLNMQLKNKREQFCVGNGEGFSVVESPSGTLGYFVSIQNEKIDYCYIITPSLFGFKAIADSLINQIFTDFVFTVESFGVNFADAAR